MAETLKIKDLPIEARPREAFMRAAEPEREMSDASLLAILIRTGCKGSNAIDLAHRLINHLCACFDSRCEACPCLANGITPTPPFARS